MAPLQAFVGVDIALSAGGILYLIIGSLVWRVEARAREPLREKRFDENTGASLERMYLDSHSYRGWYNAVHDVVNQPPFMIAGMAAASIFAILAGFMYVAHPEITLSFIVLVFILGAVLYFGDALESTLVLSFAAKSPLGKLDRANVQKYTKLVGAGKYYLLCFGACLLASSAVDAAGIVSYVQRPYGALALALVVGLALVAGWRRTLTKNRPEPR